jgi:hypothetical protein
LTENNKNIVHYFLYNHRVTKTLRHKGKKINIQLSVF